MSCIGTRTRACGQGYNALAVLPRDRNPTGSTVAVDWNTLNVASALWR